MSGKSRIQDKAFGLGLKARAQGGLEEFLTWNSCFVLEMSCWSHIGPAVCHVRLGAEGRAATFES